MPAPRDPASPDPTPPPAVAPSPAAPTPQPPQRRERGTDVARGLCVLLVVAHHAILQPESGVPTWLLDATLAAAPFRMPLLMFLAGSLVPAALTRGARSFLLARARGVLWPLVVWAVVIVGVDVARATPDGRAGDAVRFGLTHLPWGTWFLAYLLVLGATALITRRVHPGLVAAAAAAALVTVPELPGDLTGRLWALTTFFFLGVWSGRRPRALERAIASPAARWGSAVVATATAGVALAVGAEAPAFSPWSTVPVALSVVALLAGARWLAARPVGRFPALVGRRSIVWYLPHVIGVALGCDLGVALGVGAGAQVALGLIGGLTIGAALHAATARWPGADLLFRWPRRTTPGR